MKTKLIYGLILLVFGMSCALGTYEYQDRKWRAFVFDTLQSQVWKCPLCFKNADHCKHTEADYNNWIAEHKGKVFCGVLADQEWIDPIGEESIERGDGDGWYLPTQENIDKMKYYLVTLAPKGNIRVEMVGINDFSGDTDPITTKFWDEVYKDNY